jgi:bloom syndrome protein
MTRHNLAVHISWLLSTEVTQSVSIHTAPTVSTTDSRGVTEDFHADIEGQDTEDSMQSPLPSPSPIRRTVQAVNVASDFQRPPLPPKVTPKPLLREPENSIADESMGRLSSASKSVRPGLVSQRQLATPASTTGSTSSLTQGYSAFLRANNGKFGKSQ